MHPADSGRHVGLGKSRYWTTSTARSGRLSRDLPRGRRERPLLPGCIVARCRRPCEGARRSSVPIMEPVADYELGGFYGTVVFASGAVVQRERLTVYYGAADTSVCAASFATDRTADCAAAVNGLLPSSTRPVDGALTKVEVAQAPDIRPGTSTQLWRRPMSAPPDAHRSSERADCERARSAVRHMATSVQSELRTMCTAGSAAIARSVPRIAAPAVTRRIALLFPRAAKGANPSPQPQLAREAYQDFPPSLSE